MPDTIAAPKQSDFSKVSNAAVSDWMTGLKAAEVAPAQTEPAPSPPPPTTTTTPVSPAPVAPKPVEAPKPSEQPPNEPADTETDKWPRSSKDWKAFISVRDTNYKKRDDRIKELESTLAEKEKALKGLPTDQATFETLKTERERYEKEAKDLSERLRLSAIESHPRFKAYYDNKITAQIDLAKRLAGPDNADAIAETLRLPDSPYRTSRIEELSGNLSTVAASRLGSVLNSIDSIHAERQSEIDRAKTDYETAQAKSNSDAKAASEARAAEFNAKFEAIVKQASDPKDGIALFQRKDGDDAWNKTVQTRIDGARATLFGNGKSPDTDSLIRKALVAEAFPALLESYNGLLKEVATFKEQVAKLTAASPTVESRQTKPDAKSTQQYKPGSRPMEVTGDWMRGLQETAQSQA